MVAPAAVPLQVDDTPEIGFAWWLKWPSPAGQDPQRMGPARRRPVRANKNYALALALYLENRDGRGSDLPEVTKIEAKTLKQVLEIISEKTTKYKLNKDGSTEPKGNVAACGSFWWYGEKQGKMGARPCGCHNTRLCTLCALAEADKLAAGANDFIFKEVLPAAEPYLRGRLECLIRTPTVPVHKAISARLEQLQLEEKKLDRWRGEVNRLGRDAWDVLELGHPEGEIAGLQSVQLYGEGNPAEPHIHFHHTELPVVLVHEWKDVERLVFRKVVEYPRLDIEWMGKQQAFDDSVTGGWRVVKEHKGGTRQESRRKVVRERSKDFDVRPIKAMVPKELMKHQRWEWGRRQLLAAKRLDVHLPTVAGFISAERLQVAFRRQWESLAVMDRAMDERAKVQLALAATSKRAKAAKTKAKARIATWDRRIADAHGRHRANAVKLNPAMEGDLHHAFRRIGPGGYENAKGAVSYSARAPLIDLVSGLQGQGRYTWTGPKLYNGQEPNPAKYGPGARWTGIITRGGYPVYDRELPQEDVVRSIARIAEVPPKWPRLRWMGWTSQGQIKAVMKALGWERLKETPEPQFSGVLLVPVARWDDGLIFEYLSDRDTQLALRWLELSTMPVTEDGQSKVGGRRASWRPRDGPP